LAGADRFSYWADVVAQTFVPLQCETRDRSNFSGDLRHRQIGLVGITDVRSSAQRATRTPATIARGPCNDLIIVLQLRGSCNAEQQNLAARLVPGEGAVVTTDQCYFFDFPGSFRQLVLKLPACSMTEERPARTRGRKLLLSDGPAKLLQKLALALLEDPINLLAEEEIGIEDAFADLLRSAMHPPLTANANTPAVHNSAQYLAARQFIRQNLANPGLTPSAVAAHIEMSTRNLSRLFARNGTSVERTFWAERLAAARRDLIDPRLRDSSITEIAFCWAFSDAAHFSRRFSKIYGMAPTAYRAAHFGRRPGTA